MIAVFLSDNLEVFHPPDNVFNLHAPACNRLVCFFACGFLLFAQFGNIFFVPDRQLSVCMNFLYASVTAVAKHKNMGIDRCCFLENRSVMGFAIE